MLAFEEAVGHRNAPVELDLRLVDRVARVRVEDLVPGVHEGEDELADDGLAAGLDGDVLERIAVGVRAVQVFRESCAQLGNAGVRAVARLAVPDALNDASTMLAGVGMFKSPRWNG